MAHDRCFTLQGLSPCGRSSWWQSGYGPHKRGLNIKLHQAVDAHGMSIRAIITQGIRADCKESSLLIEGLSAEYLLADKGYDTNAILD